MSTVFVALFAWLLAAMSGSSMTPPAATSVAPPAPVAITQRAVAQKASAPTPSIAAAPALPASSETRVGEYPYIYVQVYCDPYIYCEVSNGTLLSTLGPMIQPNAMLPTFWVTVEAFRAYQAAQVPATPDPLATPTR